mgnify:FL=1
MIEFYPPRQVYPSPVYSGSIRYKYGTLAEKTFKAWYDYGGWPGIYVVLESAVLRVYTLTKYSGTGELYLITENIVKQGTKPKGYPRALPGEQIGATFENMIRIDWHQERKFIICDEYLQGYFGPDAYNVAKTLQKGETKKIIVTPNSEIIEIEFIKEDDTLYRNGYDFYCVTTSDKCVFTVEGLCGLGKLIMTDIQLEYYLHYRLDRETIEMLLNGEKRKEILEDRKKEESKTRTSIEVEKIDIEGKDYQKRGKIIRYYEVIVNYIS